MNLKLLSLCISAFCAAIFAVQWYNGEMVQAWVAFVWCIMVVANDLRDYLER